MDRRKNQAEERVGRTRTWTDGRGLSAWAAILLLAAMIAVAVLGLISSPAYAHDVTVKHGNDVGRVKFGHERVFVCDRERDGNRVFVKARKPSGATFRVWDTQGGDGYCNSRNPSGKVAAVKICEVGKNCNAWKQA